MLERISSAIIALAIACSANAPTRGSNAPTAPKAPASSSATVAPQADAFVAAWRNGSSIDAYLAERVTISWRGAPDEPSGPRTTLATAKAAMRLVDPIEPFRVGNKRDCDARCCRYDTAFIHGDMVSAVSSICFARNAVESIEAER